MDKNNLQKVKDFFRKEGFYVALFLCLCVITTLGTIYLKKSRNIQTNPEDNNDKEISLKVDDKNVSNDMQNAERVENTTDNNKSEDEKLAAVSNTSQVNFTNPISGTLVREFKTTPVKVEDELLVLRGIDIKSKIGTDVKAGAEGVVEEVGAGDVKDGTRVVIKHANGLKTVYSNLDTKVNVKVGDKVNTSTVIGKVGNTVKRFGDAFGEHLNLQVINANGNQVDPLKYFSYKSK